MKEKTLKLLHMYLLGHIKDRARREKIRNLAYQARAADLQDKNWYQTEIEKNISLVG